jgi:hypothetical protein
MLPASALAASFDAGLTVSLDQFPAPIVNTFGYAVLNNANLSPTLAEAFGNASASATTSTSVYNAGVLTFTAGPVSGGASPLFGYAWAESGGESQTINLGNLTGSGGPTPPARVLTEAFHGIYSFFIDATSGPGETAAAWVGFDILDQTTNTILFDFDEAVSVANGGSASDSLINVAFNFDVSIPANSIEKIRIDPIAGGTADVPEPATLSIVAMGLAVLALGRRRDKAGRGAL